MAIEVERAIDKLVAKWVTLGTEIQKAASPFDAQIADINNLRRVAVGDLEMERAAVEEKLVDYGLAAKQTIKHPGGVIISFRNGARRITYDWRIVDTVHAALADEKPKLAQQLFKARKESVGNDSASVKLGV